MGNKDYEQKKRECWETFKKENLDGEVQWQPVSRYDVYCAAFDRAYALGKLQASCEQVKETITHEEIDQAAEDYVSFEEGGKCYRTYAIERACCKAFKDGANFALGKQEKDADAVIKGWVCRDKIINEPFISDLFLAFDRPSRIEEWGKWGDMGDYIELDSSLFPDLTWDDDPIEVELIIQRKKK